MWGEQDGKGRIRELMVGCAGWRCGGDRVDKKRISKKGETGPRYKHQITLGSSAQVWPIEKEVGGRRGYLRLKEGINVA